MADDNQGLQGAVISVDPLQPAQAPQVSQTAADLPALDQSSLPAQDPGQIQQSPMQAPTDSTPPGVGRELPSLQENNQPSQLNREQGQTPAQTQKKVASFDNDKPRGPQFFGYKPPKWAHDFDYVRQHKGKGKISDSKTWLLYTVDRILKSHSV